MVKKFDCSCEGGWGWRQWERARIGLSELDRVTFARTQSALEKNKIKKNIPLLIAVELAV